MQGFPPVTDCAGHFFPPDQTGPVPRPPLLWRMLQRENHSSPESGLRPPLAPPETDTADSFWVPSVPTRLAGGPQDRGPSTCCQAGPGQGAMRAVAPPSRLHGRFSSSRELPIQGGLIQNHDLLHCKVEAAPRRVWRSEFSMGRGAQALFLSEPRSTLPRRACRVGALPGA